ncbi:MAG: hypothetical protein RLP15_05440 [Cryomorphaceae bacterium]
MKSVETMKNNRPKIIVGIVASILLIPLIAMQFSREVDWSIFDFIVAAALLLGAGFGLDFVLRRVKATGQRLMYSLAILVVLLLVWAELAVGVFGSPLAGH